MAHVPQTKHRTCHPTALSRQSAASAHDASGVPSVSVCHSTIPPPASNVATFPRSLPAHPLRPNVPLPVWVRTVLVLFRNNSPGSVAAPSAGISLASPGSNFCLHCDAEAFWLLLPDSAATTSWPADSSPPSSFCVYQPQRLAPKPLLVKVPSYSPLSSSIGSPQEVVVQGTFLITAFYSPFQRLAALDPSFRVGNDP